MAGSRRKTPKVGVTKARSEKKDKRAANRVARRKVTSALPASQEGELLPALKEVSNLWKMAKDGKIYWDSEIDPKLMRK